MFNFSKCILYKVYKKIVNTKFRFQNKNYDFEININFKRNDFILFPLRDLLTVCLSHLHNFC